MFSLVKIGVDSRSEQRVQWHCLSASVATDSVMWESGSLSDWKVDLIDFAFRLCKTFPQIPTLALEYTLLVLPVLQLFSRMCENVCCWAAPLFSDIFCSTNLSNFPNQSDARCSDDEFCFSSLVLVTSAVAAVFTKNRNKTKWCLFYPWFCGCTPTNRRQADAKSMNPVKVTARTRLSKTWKTQS